MHADRARDENYLMRNVIYILTIAARRKDQTGDVTAANLSAWRYFYLNDEGNAETNATQTRGGWRTVALAHLHILKEKNIIENMSESHFTPLSKSGFFCIVIFQNG